MRRLSLILALGTSLTAPGCLAETGSSAAPAEAAMAGYFDCLRDGGVGISAHRAQSAWSQAENSIGAIEATGRAIPNAILEIDVVETRDGELVLMHDATLDRTTNARGPVSARSLAELRRVRLVTTDGQVTDEAPPTLREALDAAGRVGAIASIDLKVHDGGDTVGLARKVIAIVREAGAQHRTILITYQQADAQAVSRLAPEMMISAGVSGHDGLRDLVPSQILAWTGSREERPAMWQRLRNQGLEVQFGTLGAPGVRLDDRYAADGDVSEYRTLFEQGVSIIATDTPMAVMGVLGDEVRKAATCERPR